MKYEVTFSGVDRAAADKLYKMGVDAGYEVEVSPDEESEMEQPKGKGVLAAVTEDD